MPDRQYSDTADANGNIAATSDGMMSGGVYDGSNRLIQVNNGSSTYPYAPDNHRVDRQ